MRHFSKRSRTRLAKVCGLAGLVIAMIAWTAPGAGAAIPHTANAAIPHTAHANAANANAPRVSAGHQAAESPAASTHPSSKPAVTCGKPGHSHSIQASAQLSDVKATGTWGGKKHRTKLTFGLRAKVRIELNLEFSGDVKCEADLEAFKFPIGDTGLIAQVGPKLEFSATGEVSADFIWTDAVEAGFSINGTHFTEGPHSATSGTAVDFTGSGTASLGLLLHATIATVGGVAGVGGYLGPVLTAHVTGSTGSDTACWKVSETPEAYFDTFVSAFGWKVTYTSPHWHLAKEQSLNGCLAKTIVFVGSPGPGIPPVRMGPHPMMPFAADPTPAGMTESNISGPTGTIDLSQPLIHDLVGDGWATWSNGYNGDVYQDATALPGGNFEITVTLPPGTGAFYAYAEPNLFKDYAINATANNGVTSGDVTVNGKAGARYFGFYATCGHTLKSVTYIDSGGDTAMAIGEFGIAPAC